MSVYNDQELDALFQDAASAVNVPDSAAYWDSAKSFIAAKKSNKKRFIIYFLFLGMSLAGVLGFVSISENEFFHNSNAVATKHEAAQFPKNNTDVNSSPISANEEKKDNSFDPNKPQENTNSSLESVTEIKPKSVGNQKFERTANIKKSNAVLQPSNGLAVNDSFIENTEIVNEIAQNIETQSSRIERPVQQTIKENSINESPQFLPSESTEAPEFIANLDFMAPILFDSLSYHQPSFRLSPNGHKQSKPANWNVILGARMGPSFGFPHSLISEKSSNIELLRHDRINISFSPAIDVTIRKNSWLLSSGIEMQTFKNDFLFNSLYTFPSTYPVYDDNSYWLVENTTFVFVDSIFYYDSGTPIYSVDTVKVQINDSSYISKIDTTFQSYYDSSWYDTSLTSHASYLEIPLLVGYEFGNKKLKFSLLTGVSLGMITGYNFRLIDLPASTTDARLYEPYQFKKTLVNFILKTRLSYPINSFGIYSDIYFKSNLNGLLETNDHLEWKQNNLNIGIGAFYTF